MAAGSSVSGLGAALSGETRASGLREGIVRGVTGFAIVWVYVRDERGQVSFEWRKRRPLWARTGLGLTEFVSLCGALPFWVYAGSDGLSREFVVRWGTG